jgi:hypothetical protein
VKHSVVRHLIDLGEVKLVVADKGIFKKSLIHHFDNYLSLFEFVRFLVFRLEKDVFVPDSNASVVNVVLCCRELALFYTLDLHNWIDCFFRWNFEVFGLFYVDVDHVVASLHLAD